MSGGGMSGVVDGDGEDWQVSTLGQNGMFFTYSGLRIFVNRILGEFARGHVAGWVGSGVWICAR